MRSTGPSRDQDRRQTKGPAEEPETANRGAAPPAAPTLDRLAEDWIALWQEEIAALAADPELAALWRQASAAGAAWLAMAPAAGWRHDPPAGSAAPGAAPGAGGTAAGGGDGQSALEPGSGPENGPGSRQHHAGADTGGGTTRLRARIDELERRLATLEAGAGGGGADRRGPRRRTPPA